MEAHFRAKLKTGFPTGLENAMYYVNTFLIPPPLTKQIK